MAFSMCARCGQRLPDDVLQGLCAFCLLNATSTREYTTVNVLGRGRHGTIYLAEEWPARRVAVKVLHGGERPDRPLERLERVSRTLATMAHPLISGYIALGVTNDSRPYIVRNFVRGTPITLHCRQRQADASTRRQFMATLFEIVADARRCGLVHGGLVPANIFVVNHDGELTVNVTDFGVRDGCLDDDNMALDTLGTALM